MEKFRDFRTRSKISNTVETISKKDFSRFFKLNSSRSKIQILKFQFSAKKFPIKKYHVPISFKFEIVQKFPDFLKINSWKYIVRYLKFKKRIKKQARKIITSYTTSSKRISRISDEHRQIIGAHETFGKRDKNINHTEERKHPVRNHEGSPANTGWVNSSCHLKRLIGDRLFRVTVE